MRGFETFQRLPQSLEFLSHDRPSIPSPQVSVAVLRVRSDAPPVGLGIRSCKTLRGGMAAGTAKRLPAMGGALRDTQDRHAGESLKLSWHDQEGSRAFKIVSSGVGKKRKRKENDAAGSRKRRRLWEGSRTWDPGGRGTVGGVLKGRIGNVAEEAGKRKRRRIGEGDRMYDPGEFENIDSEGAALPVPLQLEFGEAKLNGKLADFFLDKNQYPANPNRTISNTVTLNMPFGTNRINVGDGIIIDFKNPRKNPNFSKSPSLPPVKERRGCVVAGGKSCGEDGLVNLIEEPQTSYRVAADGHRFVEVRDFLTSEIRQKANKWGQGSRQGRGSRKRARVARLVAHEIMKAYGITFAQAWEMVRKSWKNRSVEQHGKKRRPMFSKPRIGSAIIGGRFNIMIDDENPEGEGEGTLDRDSGPAMGYRLPSLGLTPSTKRRRTYRRAVVAIGGRKEMVRRYGEAFVIKCEDHFKRGRPSKSREEIRAEDLRRQGRFAQQGGGLQEGGKKSKSVRTAKTMILDEVGCWNARSLKSDSRVQEFKENINARPRTALVGIGETWQNETRTKAWYEQRLRGFRWFGRNRSSGRGGGVAMLVRRELVDDGSFRVVDDKILIAGSEAFMVGSLRHPQGLIYVINGYIENENRANIFRGLGELCKMYRAKKGVLDVILLGDLNVQETDMKELVSEAWGNRAEPMGARNIGTKEEREAFMKCCDAFKAADWHAHRHPGVNTRVQVTAKTEQRSRIDHMIVTKPNLYHAGGVVEEKWSESDHRYLWLRIGNWGRIQKERIGRSKELVWDVAKLSGPGADKYSTDLAAGAKIQLSRVKFDSSMDRFRRDGGSVDIRGAEEHISRGLIRFTGALDRAARGSIGCKRKGGGFGSEDGRARSWVTPEIKEAWLVKRRLYRECMCISRSDQEAREVAWKAYKVCRNATRNLERKLQSASERGKLEELAELHKSQSKKFYEELNRKGGVEKKGDSTIYGVREGEEVVRGEGVKKCFVDTWAKISTDSISDGYNMDSRSRACALRERRKLEPLPMEKEFYVEWRVPEVVKDPERKRSWRELEKGLGALPGLEEVRRALHSGVTKSGKAAGEDKVLGIVLRAADGEGEVTKALWPIFQNCFKFGIFPAAWKTAVCVPLAKTEDKEAAPTEYRMIALLSLIGKVYEALIEERIATMLEQQRNLTDPSEVGSDFTPLAEEQYGFRHDKRSTTDAAWLLSGIIRANGRRKKKTYVAFLDIKKAYPRTNHAVLLKACWDQGIRGAMYATIESHLSNRRHMILVNGEYSESYGVSVGLAEGSILSPVLFSIYINSIVARLNEAGEGVKLMNDEGGEFNLRCLLYADDLAIVSDSIEDLNKMLEAAGLWAAESQTEFNFGKGKTEFVCYGAEKRGISGEAKILGRDIKEVDLYRYLGVDLHRELGFNGNLSMEEMNLKPKARKQEGLQRAKSGGAGGQGISFFPYISACARKMTNKRGICNTMGMRGGGFSTDICKKLMSTFVLSQAQYSIPVWGMDCVKDSQLERAQIESAKHILGLEDAAVSYDVVRCELGLLAMSRRRMMAELVYYWKILHMPVGRQQRKFVEFLEGDGTGSGSSRNWLVEYIRPVIKSWALPDPEKVRKLEDWRLLVRRKAINEEIKTLEDSRAKSSAKEYCYDYLEVRNGYKGTMPSYLRGWENVGRLRGRILLTNIRLRALPLGCRRGWAGSKACPLCDILRNSGDPVVEEDELHVFAGKCPVLRTTELYGEFRDLITRVLIANNERYIFDVKKEAGLGWV